MKPATALTKSTRGDDQPSSGRRSFIGKLNPSFLKKAKDGDSLKLVKDDPKSTKKLKKKAKSSPPKKTTPASDLEEDEINIDDE